MDEPAITLERASEMVASLDPQALATLKQQLAEKEAQQKKHYFYLSELQNMARELQGKYQQRMPYDLLCTVANAILDGTVFDIVLSYKELQQLEERNLSSQRLKLINDNKAAKLSLQKKHKEVLQDSLMNRPHHFTFVETQCKKEMETFEKKCEEELKRKDMKIILELDQKVMDQQVTLERAGVPGFYVTNNPDEVKMQKYLLDFIVRLSQLTIPS